MFIVEAKLAAKLLQIVLENLFIKIHNVILQQLGQVTVLAEGIGHRIEL